ncbi:unnamed protein product [marine sediment metagenome]|uniref:Uncharacterized protein n=1 Tax=marine sediment metagenome TaxID=412755 RepID=X0YN95_9ZZZZ
MAEAEVPKIGEVLISVFDRVTWLYSAIAGPDEVVPSDGWVELIVVQFASGLETGCLMR